MIIRWVHIVSPDEFDQLPHLYCVGTAMENSPTYYMVQKQAKNVRRSVLQYTLEGNERITCKGTTYPVEVR